LSAPTEAIRDQSWLVWQLVDSAFPTGGFAHSGGLEAAWQQGEVRSRADVESFIRLGLRQVGRGLAPFVRASFQEPERLTELDELCDAFMTSHVANRASRLQGRALWNGVMKTFLGFRPMTEIPASPPFHHLAPVFGALARVLDLESAMALRIFLFQHLRGWVASGVRLGIVGPMEGQGIQHKLGLEAEEVLTRCLRFKIDDVAQVAPMIEIWQGAQDRLYSRLFQS
jgi:urease accessory protein